MKNVSRNSKFD